MPAHSSPKVGPANPSISASSGSSPIAHIMSRKLSPAACTSTSTWPGPTGRGAPTSHPRESRPPGWRLPSVRTSEGSANRGGRPRRTRSTCRPSGVQTISSSVLEADSSAAICRARSFAARVAGRSTRRSESRGISLASTRAKLHIAPPTRPDASPISDDCWASQVMTQSSERRSAACVATRANAAICCEASSVGSSGQEPSARKRIVGGGASPPL